MAYEHVAPVVIQANACRAYGFMRPNNRTQWQLCVRYWADHTRSGLEVQCCRFMAMLFDCPLSEAEVISIAIEQRDNKRRSN